MQLVRVYVRYMMCYPIALNHSHVNRDNKTDVDGVLHRHFF